MNRVLSALSEKRCVLALSSKACNDLLQTEEFTDRKGHPWMIFGAEAQNGLPATTPEGLAPCTEKPGGLLVLIDPDFSRDSEGFKALEACLSGAPNKPRLLVLARLFNPFQLPMGIRTLKLDQLKLKSKDFLSGLPATAGADAPEEPVPAKSKKRSSGTRAPQPVFLGRESEKAALLEAIATTGPTLLLGASGLGKHWLVEETIGKSEELELLEEVVLGSGVGFDSLSARLCELSSNKKLLTAQTRNALSPKDLVKGIVTGLQKEGLSGRVLPISGIEPLLRRDGSLNRDDRLSMLLRALWTTPTTLPIVFLSSEAPARLGTESTLKTVELQGLTREDIAGLFKAYYIDDASDEHIAEVHRRTLGHPAYISSVYARA